MPSGFNYPSSWTDIANLALGRLGKGEINTLLQQHNELASYCRLFMGQAVDNVFTKHSWKGATRRAQLARLVETPAFGFAYFYQLPSDWVRNPDREKEGKRSNIDTGRQEYTIEGDRLLTDAETVYMSYIARPEDASKLRPYLHTAIALCLAFLLTTPLTHDEELARRIDGEYKDAIDAAIAADNLLHEEQTQEKEIGVTWFDEMR